jgi:hypothetical protein
MSAHYNFILAGTGRPEQTRQGLVEAVRRVFGMLPPPIEICLHAYLAQTMTCGHWSPTSDFLSSPLATGQSIVVYFDATTSSDGGRCSLAIEDADSSLLCTLSLNDRIRTLLHNPAPYCEALADTLGEGPCMSLCGEELDFDPQSGGMPVNLRRAMADWRCDCIVVPKDVGFASTPDGWSVRPTANRAVWTRR